MNEPKNPAKSHPFVVTISALQERLHEESQVGAPKEKTGQGKAPDKKSAEFLQPAGPEAPMPQHESCGKDVRDASHGAQEQELPTSANPKAAKGSHVPSQLPTTEQELAVTGPKNLTDPEGDFGATLEGDLFAVTVEKGVGIIVEVKKNDLFVNNSATLFWLTFVKVSITVKVTRSVTRDRGMFLELQDMLSLPQMQVQVSSS